MLISEFDYALPEELIAQKPLDRRDAARMLFVDRSTKEIRHGSFKDLPDLLSPGDLLVFNESRVLYARLLGQRSTGGKVEVFLLKPISENRWECLLKATATQKIGMEFTIGGKLHGTVLEPVPHGISFVVEFHLEGRALNSYLEELGHVPLPPYIKREDVIDDRERYQTIYARDLGSVAAPTAGLHYSAEMFERLKSCGVQTSFVQLHVGLGTFQPIKANDIREHRMHREKFFVTSETRDLVRATRAKGKRVVAVGTTSCRSLESAARGIETETDLYLYPGSEFLWVNGLHTNFHQPKSSLLVMLAAFMGKDLLFKAYEEAMREKYRFLSYGDCMLVL